MGTSENDSLWPDNGRLVAIQRGFVPGIEALQIGELECATRTSFRSAAKVIGCETNKAGVLTPASNNAPPA